MLNSRVYKALALIGSGSVVPYGGGRYGVISWATPSTIYQVRENYCNCPDYAYRGTEPCAHLLAVSMTKGLEAVNG